MPPVAQSIRNTAAAFMIAFLYAQAIVPAAAFAGRGDFTGGPAVSEAVLDRLRGGFQGSPNGPILAFGIERKVFLNGQLVSSALLTIPNLSQLSSAPGKAFALIQNGGGNTLALGTSALPFMNVIQNSLDSQTIQHQTVVNATVAALSWARSLALGNAMSQATVNAIRH